MKKDSSQITVEYVSVLTVEVSILLKKFDKVIQNKLYGGRNWYGNKLKSKGQGPAKEFEIVFSFVQCKIQQKNIGMKF